MPIEPEHDGEQEVVAEDLKEQARNLEQEARMILPGIQALFGFQLIAVFNQRFADLEQSYKTVHLVAILLSVLSLALAVAPAAYHREVERKQISKRFIKIANGYLCWAMLPLALSMTFDIFVICEIILESVVASVVVATSAALLLLALWYLVPRLMRRHLQAKI